MAAYETGSVCVESNRDAKQSTDTLIPDDAPNQFSLMVETGAVLILYLHSIMARPIPTDAQDYSRLEGTVFSRRQTRELCALVVGVGALGNEVIKTLGLLGLGKLIVVDADEVEPSNLTRSILFRGPGMVGRNKALAAADVVARLFPDTTVVAISREVADVGFQHIREANIIFSCVDSDLARLEIAYISTKLDIPVSDGGLGTPDYSRGRVTYFPGRSASCYCCLLTRQKRRELLTLWESSHRRCWELAADLRGGAYPSTPTMASIVAAIQVELGLRQFFDDRHVGEVEASTVEVRFDGLPSLERFRLSLNPTCPFHSVDLELVPSPGPEAETTVEDLLNVIGKSSHEQVALVFDWPICTAARCIDCGWAWSPMQRLGSFRKFGRCPSCESRKIEERESVRSVRRGSEWSHRTLAELGLPERHLHSVRLN